MIFRNRWGTLAGHKDRPMVNAALDAWFDEVKKARWTRSAEVRRSYATASIVTALRDGDRRVTTFLAMTFHTLGSPTGRHGTRRDLEPLIGTRTRVAEVVTRKRGLSIGMIRRLHDRLGISAEVLIRRSQKEKAA
jgi:hypothetical protein